MCPAGKRLPNRSRLLLLTQGGAIEHCVCLIVVEAEPTKHEIARVAHCSLGNVAAVILRLAVAISHSAGRLDDHPQHVLNGGAFFQRHWVSPPCSGRRALAPLSCDLRTPAARTAIRRRFPRHERRRA